MKKTIAAMASALILAGCMTSSNSAKIGDQLFNKEWQLSQIDGAFIDTEIVKQVPNFTLETGGRITGVGGCNRFFGDATLDGTHLSAPALASTKMMCIQNEVATIEAQFMQALSQGVHVEFLNESEVTLKGEAHTFVFTR
ncbi:META domain-containing protein [Thaumasiovibrio subtropicus]|uniref:META domain-containing protein n=1 Tax=Thaumasiovibrio subtropicus TaxID=1891207 RepID=UPI00131EAAF4|nr:META domain-containing protein [Thaumasiovibrio subtropicus]